MYIDDRGIVLQVVRYGDASSVAHVFTRSHGHVSFMASRPKSRSSAGRAAVSLLSPLNVLAFQWDLKPRASMYRMKDVHAACVWQDLPYHPAKSAMAMLLGEFLIGALHGEEINEDLFDYITASFQWLDVATEQYANFHLVFLLKVARFLGVAPDDSSYVRGSQFDLESGRFVSMVPSSPYVLTAPDAELFYRLLIADYTTMASIAMNRSDRVRLLTYVQRFYALHIPGFPELKSLKVLETLFD